MHAQEKLHINSTKDSTQNFLIRFDALKVRTGYTEDDLASKIGYSRSWVQKLKKGEVYPRHRAWTGLQAAEAEFLNARPAEFSTLPAAMPAPHTTSRTFLEALEIIRRIEQDPELFAISSVEAALGRPLTDADRQKTWDEVLSEIHQRQTHPPAAP
jgi:transcriptional regulator with XRE-family HTH domain